MSEIPFYRDSETLNELVETRRRFHRYPELSWTEFHTTAQLCAELEELGFTVNWGIELYGDLLPHNTPSTDVMEAAFQKALETLGPNNKHLPDMAGGYTGLVATIEGGQPGRTYGYRFDIDALPIPESEKSTHLPSDGDFSSQNAGVMHACGHDGHLTIGLGLARKLAASRSSLRGQVHLFFQPAEEVAGGGILFAQLPQMKEVDNFLTLHLGITNERKLVCNATWIAAQIFDVTITGRASHAGNAPQEGRNALLAACQMVQALYAIPRHSGGMSRVNVGSFRADNPNNVVADHVTFRFEVRGGENTICGYMAEEARRILKGAAEMNECSAEITPVAHFENHLNNTSLASKMREIAQSLGVPKDAIIDSYHVPASEDATFMTKVVHENGGEATYMILGCPVRGGHHNSTFDFDEDLLGWGVELCFNAITQ